MIRVVGLDMHLLSATPVGDLEGMLAPSELRTLRKQTKRHRRAWAAGRLALKLAAGSYACKPWHRIETGHHAGGRPRIVGEPGACCSISHSGPLAVAAVADAPVGVDIERIRPRHRAFLDYVAGPEEVEIVGSEHDGERPAGLVTNLWTIKEACLKRGGWGLAIPVRAARIAGRTEPGRVEVEVRWHDVREQCSVWTTLVRGFSLSIASDEPDPLGDVRWDAPLRRSAG